MAVPNFEDFDADFASPAQWAAMYRHYGLQVIPCYSPAEVKPGTAWKRPLLSTWTTLQEELVPEATFARWYDIASGDHRNRRNMGVISGACSGRVFVLDLDSHKQPEALAWWGAVCRLHNNGLELETPRQKTGEAASSCCSAPQRVGPPRPTEPSVASMCAVRAALP